MDDMDQDATSDEADKAIASLRNDNYPDEWHAAVLVAEVERLRALIDPDLLALHRVALQAREAVSIAAAAGVHLGPLRAALDATAYRVGSG